MSHSLATSNKGATVEGIIGHMCHSIVMSALALALFGVLLLVRHSNQKYPPLRKMAQIGIICLFVGVTGAVASVVQGEMVAIFSSRWIGVAGGGFIGAVVVAGAGYCSRKIEGLSGFFLVRLAWTFVIVGCFILSITAIIVSYTLI